MKALRQAQMAVRSVFHGAFFDRYVERIRNRGPIDDIDVLYDYATRANMAILTCIQSRQELIPVLRRVKALNPAVVMEIGTANGATLFMLTRVAREDAAIISLDLPGGAFGGGYAQERIPLYEAFALGGQDMHLVRDDSHSERSLEKVRSVLAGKQIDFLLIDGDHTYEGVRQDYEMYGALVRPGGVIAFHDTVYAEGVRKFVDELKADGQTVEEFVADSGQKYGLGLVQKA